MKTGFRLKAFVIERHVTPDSVRHCSSNNKTRMWCWFRQKNGKFLFMGERLTIVFKMTVFDRITTTKNTKCITKVKLIISLNVLFSLIFNVYYAYQLDDRNNFFVTMSYIYGKINKKKNIFDSVYHHFSTVD